MSPGTLGGAQLCPWRGKLGSWHHITPGLGWGRGCPCIHVPAGCPGDGWGSGAVPHWIHGIPRARDVPPKGPGNSPWHSPGLTLTASCLCHRATMCWRMRTPLLHRKTVKGPGLLLSPCFQLTVTASRGCRAVPSSPEAIRESPGGLWNQGNISHSKDTHGGAENQWVGGARQPWVPQRAQCGTWSTDGVQDPVGFPISQKGKRLLSLCFFPCQGLFSNL